jgi:hypothetical protein
VVVDFGVGQETSFLAEYDQILELRATRLSLDRRQLFQGQQGLGFLGAAARFSSTYSHRISPLNRSVQAMSRAEKNRSKTGNYTANEAFVCAHA